MFNEHPALIISTLYVAASVVGMFYYWAYLRRFQVNVFAYAQISDFLLVSLKEPFTWGLVFLSLALVITDNTMSRRVERGSPARWIAWYGTPRYRFINNFVAIYIVFSFIYLFAAFQANNTRNGDGKIIDVEFAGNGERTTTTLLGTTSLYIFLFDAPTDRVSVHPIENIHRISFPGDAAPSTTAAGDPEAVLVIQQARFEAMINADMAALDEILADDLVYIHTTGSRDSKTELMNSIRDGVVDYRVIKPDDVQVRLIGNQSVVTGSAEFQVFAANQLHDLDIRFTEVYLRRDGWQLISWQSTRVP